MQRNSPTVRLSPPSTPPNLVLPAGSAGGPSMVVPPAFPMYPHHSSQPGIAPYNAMQPRGPYISPPFHYMTHLPLYTTTQPPGPQLQDRGPPAFQAPVQFAPAPALGREPSLTGIATQSSVRPRPNSEPAPGGMMSPIYAVLAHCILTWCSLLVPGHRYQR